VRIGPATSSACALRSFSSFSFSPLNSKTPTPNIPVRSGLSQPKVASRTRGDYSVRGLHTAAVFEKSRRRTGTVPLVVKPLSEGNRRGYLTTKPRFSDGVDSASQDYQNQVCEQSLALSLFYALSCVRTMHMVRSGA
jgi:hypothetical protein